VECSMHVCPSGFGEHLHFERWTRDGCEFDDRLPFRLESAEPLADGVANPLRSANVVDRGYEVNIVRDLHSVCCEELPPELADKQWRPVRQFDERSDQLRRRLGGSRFTYKRRDVFSAKPPKREAYDAFEAPQVGERIDRSSSRVRDDVSIRRDDEH